MGLWETLGPVGYRLRSVGGAALLALAAVVIFLLGMTATSLFPGSGAVYQGPGEHPVRVVVADCQRVGPISHRGLGYWWECDALATAADGTSREARIGRSVVSPKIEAGRSSYKRVAVTKIPLPTARMAGPPVGGSRELCC
ncbi:DUF6346 domain-containing protein [Micromonospora sp. NPDC049102]|uniref:DUF6346 domain-containing protein n=1 Tax=Micromonospora sp. NPDC049102 TaxID=3364265 RepID=UPI00371886D7